MRDFRHLFWKSFLFLAFTIRYFLQIALTLIERKQKSIIKMHLDSLKCIKIQSLKMFFHFVYDQLGYNPIRITVQPAFMFRQNTFCPKQKEIL